MNPNDPDALQRAAVRQALAQGTTLGTQAGCAGVALILGALLLGRWLDSQFGTRPWLSLGLLCLSIPTSLYLMVRLVLRAVGQPRPVGQTERPSEKSLEARVPAGVANREACPERSRRDAVGERFQTGTEEKESDHGEIH